MANIIESRVTLEDEVFEETIDTMEEPIEVVRPSSYNDLEDLPQINGVTLTGNKTSEELGIVTATDIENAVSAEATLRENADTALGGRIDGEKTARENADTALGGRIDTEITNRTDADRALGTRIDNEILARQGGDNNLQTQIDAITSKSDVVDVVADYAALQAYDTSTLGNNDVVKVLDDETHGDAMTYYRWSTTTQTWSYIGSEAPYYSKGQMDTMLLGKQDKIDSTHKLSADLVDDTSTTNKFVTAQDKITWNSKQNALTAGTGINIENGVVSTPAVVPEVVAELPATGTEGKLYLTPKNYTRGTGTGNPIVATITDESGKVESFRLDGDTSQQTYTGKNLIGFGTYSLEKSGITCTTSPDGTITLNGTRTGTTTGAIIFGTNSPKFNLSGTFTMTIIVLSGSFSGANIGYNATDENGTQRFYQEYGSNGIYNQETLTPTQAQLDAITGVNVLVGSGASTFDNLKFKIQVTAGEDHDSDYEPFVGGVPSPNPSYPQPIQTVTGEQTVEIVGKNLFDKTSQISNGYSYSSTGSKDVLGTSSVQESYISVSPSTTYTLHTDATSSQTTNFRVFICEYDSSKGFIQRDIPAQTTSNTNTITTTANTYFVRLCFSTVGIDTLQFEKSASPTTYAPYSKQTLPINLGKNLFDKDTAVILTGELNSDKTYSTDAGKTIYIECKPNTTYSVQKADIGNRARLGTSTGYLPNGGIATNYVAMSTIASGKRYGRITTGQNDRYLWFTFARGDDAEEIVTRVIDSIQIEVGAQYSSYAPYKTPIELCKLGTYQDYIWKDGEDWKVHKANGYELMTGASYEPWGKSNSTANNLYIHQVYAMVKDNSTIEFPIFCDGFSYVNRTVIYSQSKVGITTQTTGSGDSAIRIGFGISSSINTVPLMRQWLSENNMQLYYPLATPTDTTITDQALIAQLEAIRTASLENGTNTIVNSTPASNLAGDMEVGYYGYNPRNRYDKWLWLDLNNNYEQIGS